MAQFLADHALVLFGIGLLLLSIGVVVVVALASVAARYKDLFWSLADRLVPGHLWRPRVYLAVHLTLGLVLTAAIGAFVVIAEDVVASRQLAAFDLAFAEALRAETSPAWHAVFWYLTWLGSGYVIAPVAAAVVWLLAKRRLALLAVMWSIALGGSALINYAMKVAFARARPDGADRLLHSGGWSFPSGHAMNSLVLCGIAAYLVWRLSGSWRRTVVLTTLLFAFALVMGFSRMYLGVHYASDVMAGYLAGTAWVAVCVSGTEVALRRRSTT